MPDKSIPSKPETSGGNGHGYDPKKDKDHKEHEKKNREDLKKKIREINQGKDKPK